MAASSSDSAAVGIHRSGFLRGTFKAMSDWGDEFERRHFDGDLKGALVRAPQKAKVVGSSTFKAMNKWGDDFERRHFDGDFVGALTKAPQKAGSVISSTLEVIDSSLEGIVPTPAHARDAAISVAVCLNTSTFTTDQSSTEVTATRGNTSATAEARHRFVGSWEEVQHLQDERRLKVDARSGSTPGLWEAAQRLKDEIAEERERRRGRAVALDALDEALRLQRLELAEERQLVASAEEQRSVADLRSYASERAFAQLQERHHALLSRRASHEAELQQRALDVAAAAAAAAHDKHLRESEGPRAWARAGPEMEALKEAKLELAEVLGLLDEARMHRRQELWALEKQITDLACENKTFRLASDGYVAPEGSFRSSLRRLVAVAMGRGDPYATAERGVV